MTKHLWTLVVIAAAGSQLGSTTCAGDAIRDPSFDLWCGDALCAWKTERGAIHKVGTWNPGDPGVSFDGDDVAIEQLSPLSSYDGPCVQFKMISKIDATANVELNVDVSGDGSVELSQRIPDSNWKPLTLLFRFSGTFEGVRFEIAKMGGGAAVLAQVEATVVADPSACDGFPPIVPMPAPLGAVCGGNADCRSDLCIGTDPFPKHCAACDGSVVLCSGGEVCGLGPALSPVYSPPAQCVATGSHQLGELCIADAECTTGYCEHFYCSTCHTALSAGCATGETCGPAWPKDPNLNPSGNSPFVCQPNAHARTSGQPCASDDDCASSTCDGTPRSQCDDGRACTTAAECPFGGPDTLNGLQQGPCNIVGIQGGTCR
jgi:hypothetical protein